MSSYDLAKISHQSSAGIYKPKKRAQNGCRRTSICRANDRNRHYSRKFRFETTNKVTRGCWLLCINVLDVFAVVLLHGIHTCFIDHCNLDFLLIDLKNTKLQVQ